MPETRTYADRAEYLKKAVMKRRKKLRDTALEYGGANCHAEVHDGVTQLPAGM